MAFIHLIAHIKLGLTHLDPVCFCDFFSEDSEVLEKCNSCNTGMRALPNMYV